MTSATDFFELDFLAVEAKKSGDAITFYYSVDGDERVHVIDGGYTATGEKILSHIDNYYSRKIIDVVTVTHSDADHVLGLKHVLENGDVRALVMNRPWIHAAELIEYFPTYNSVDALRAKLRIAYDYIADLEDIAEARGIPIYSAFTGFKIYEMTVLAPSKDRYFRLIAESDRTPSSTLLDEGTKVIASAIRMIKAAINLVTSAWNEEYFPTDPTNRENEMSLIQYGEIGGQKILLTGDAGREALQEFIDVAPYYGVYLPGISRFQVPHHGSRRNVSTALLDTILGPRIPEGTYTGGRFHALISSAKEDLHHPKNAVVRAMIHRDATVIKTEGIDKYTRYNRPMRNGWGPIPAVEYPDTQED